MAKDNKRIKELLKQWSEIQERRLNKMKLNGVRVSVGGIQYYARVKVTSEDITIIPDDPEILGTAFGELHLNGFMEIETRGIRLNQRFERPPLKLFFRTPQQKDHAMSRIKILLGAESTSSSTSESTSPGSA